MDSEKVAFTPLTGVGDIIIFKNEPKDEQVNLPLDIDIHTIQANGLPLTPSLCYLLKNGAEEEKMKEEMEFIYNQRNTKKKQRKAIEMVAEKLGMNPNSNGNKKPDNSREQELSIAMQKENLINKPRSQPKPP